MWLSFLEYRERERWEEMKAEEKGLKQETESHREGRDKRAANDKQRGGRRARDKPLEKNQSL